MYILGIETTGKFASVALIDDDGFIVSFSSPEEMNHLKDIMILVDKCIQEREINKKDITHVAVSIGPGSFTGIRIGVTVAKTLAQAFGIPCIPVSTLEVLGIGAVRSYSGSTGCEVDDASCENGIECFRSDDAGCSKYVCSIINARRGQTYGAIWCVEGDILIPVLPQAQYMIDEILLETSKLSAVLFTGDGVDAYSEIITADFAAGAYSFADQSSRYQNAQSVVFIAKKKLENNPDEAVCGYMDLLPDYMRKSEAEMRFESGSLSDKIKKTSPANTNIR